MKSAKCYSNSQITSSMYFRCTKFFTNRKKEKTFFSSDVLNNLGLFLNPFTYPYKLATLCCLPCNFKLNSFKCCVITVKNARNSGLQFSFYISRIGFYFIFKKIWEFPSVKRKSAAHTDQHLTIEFLSVIDNPHRLRKIFWNAANKNN